MFKVRDIVKGTNNSDYGVTNEYMYKGKIVRIRDNGNIDIEILDHNLKSEIGERYDDLDPKYFELVEEYKYTYEDLKKAPVGTKVLLEKLKDEILIKITNNKYESDNYRFFIREFEKLKIPGFGKIIKIEEPTYSTVYEYKPEILDEVEKRYLSNFIRPFKDGVETISRTRSLEKDKDYIQIRYKDDEPTNLPYFEKDTMYKGMKLYKEYTLEELGL